MRRFSFTTTVNLLILVGILVFFLPVMCANAQDAMGLKMGDTIVARVPICLSQESAVKVAVTDSEKGVPAALDAIIAAKDCGIGVVNIRLVKIVAQYSTERKAILKVVEVRVEMQDDSWKPAWVLMDIPIQGAHQT